MSLHRVWRLPLGLLLVAGIVGCGKRSAPESAPKPNTEPKPVVEVEAVAEPEPDEATRTPPKPDIGRNAAGVSAARSQIGVIEAALSLYQVNLGEYPSTTQGLEALRKPPSDLPDPNLWIEPYMQKNIPTDPWGAPYQYEYPGTHNEDWPDVWSMGPDMQDGTEDDIGNWPPE